MKSKVFSFISISALLAACIAEASIMTAGTQKLHDVRGSVEKIVKHSYKRARMFVSRLRGNQNHSQKKIDAARKKFAIGILSTVIFCYSVRAWKNYFTARSVDKTDKSFSFLNEKDDKKGPPMPTREPPQPPIKIKEIEPTKIKQDEINKMRSCLTILLEQAGEKEPSQKLVDTMNGILKAEPTILEYPIDKMIPENDLSSFAQKTKIKTTVSDGTLVTPKTILQFTNEIAKKRNLKVEHGTLSLPKKKWWKLGRA